MCQIWQLPVDLLNVKSADSQPPQFASDAPGTYQQPLDNIKVILTSNLTEWPTRSYRYSSITLPAGCCAVMLLQRIWILLRMNMIATLAKSPITLQQPTKWLVAQDDFFAQYIRKWG